MRIAIASPLDEALVARIASAAPDDTVAFEPSLLPPIRYPSDHRGDPAFVRSGADEARYWTMISAADVIFGVPSDSADGLAQAVRRAPNLRWIAATAAGAGEQMRGANLTPEELARVVVTSAAGVHGTMLAEFVFSGLLALRKAHDRLRQIRAERAWPHFAMGELRGETIAIVGMGGIGRAVASIARAFRMRVLAITRSGTPLSEADAVFPTSELVAAAAQSQSLVVTLPATELTRGLIDRAVIDALPPSAIVVNVGRAAVVDQVALIEALEAGRIGGAVLDVGEPEPLPPENALWTLPNVIFSPHTAALSVHENERIVDLFIDNLARLRSGSSLRNVIDTHEFF